MRRWKRMLRITIWRGQSTWGMSERGLLASLPVFRWLKAQGHRDRVDSFLQKSTVRRSRTVAGGPSCERGILFGFKPTLKPITTALRINLYYTGLTDTAEVLLHDDGSPQLLQLARDYSVLVPLTVAAGGYSWFAIRDGHKG